MVQQVPEPYINQVVRDGDCLVWKGLTTLSGHPIARVKNDSLVYFIPYLWKQERGNPGIHYALRSLCGKSDCLVLDHKEILSLKKDTQND